MKKYFYYTISLSSLWNWDYLGYGSQPYKRGHLLFGEATQLLSENTKMFFAIESILLVERNMSKSSFSILVEAEKFHYFLPT